MQSSHARLLTGLALALAVAAGVWTMHGRAAWPRSASVTTSAAPSAAPGAMTGLATHATGGVPVAAATANTAARLATGAADHPALTAARYVGGQACGGCHPAERAAWLTSHHAHSMQPAKEHTVLGDFRDITFTQGNRSTRFFRRDGRFYVHTDGPDGKPADFEITWTFGVEPLQQYLVDFPDGRKQALSIAWDSRPKAAGGQHWFSLYSRERIEAGDRLHWTGIDQNWNHQCADCHSTNLRKNFDAQANAFRTTWSDPQVDCEACHGPGSRHLDWAHRHETWNEPGKGLVVALDERRAVSWSISADTGLGTRSSPRTSSREIEACAPCHARRERFSDDAAGTAFTDVFRPAALAAPLYYADGQMREEVYEYGSFLQSRMNARGVTCSDCHEPHSQQLRAPGNALCAQCHAPARFDTARHHHHPVSSRGAQCVACHMPAHTYMRIDVRHDHSLRIPRPDLSMALGTPNACTDCHRNREASWAARAIKTWFPTPKPGFQDFAAAFAAADRGESDAHAPLERLASSRTEPAIVRASALRRLARLMSSSGLVNASLAGTDATSPEAASPHAASSEAVALTTKGPAAANSGSATFGAADSDFATRNAFEIALSDPDPLVRTAAVAGLIEIAPALRAESLRTALADPSRMVRIELARTLAGTPADGPALAPALEDFFAEQRLNADRPEAHIETGNLAAARGQLDAAAREFRQALILDPALTGAAINLADLHRSQGEEPLAEQALREALRHAPSSAPAHHALGLSLVRQRRLSEALAELARAAELEPQQAHWSYVQAIALFDTGHHDQARRVLRAALRRHPQDRELRQAEASFRAAGD